MTGLSGTEWGEKLDMKLFNNDNNKNSEKNTYRIVIHLTKE